MKTSINLSPRHPVSKFQQTEIALHGGFEFLGASSFIEPPFGDEALRHDFFVVDLRAPGGEALKLYIDAADADTQAKNARLIASSLATLAVYAKREPNVSRDVDADGNLRPLRMTA